VKLLLRLSGEHPTLPLAELSGVLSGEKISWRLVERDRKNRSILIDVASKRKDFLKRLALTQEVVEVFSTGKDMSRIASDVYPRLKRAKSFRVRSESNTVERELGAILHNRGLKVNLTKPEKTVTVVRFGRVFAAGFDVPLEKNFEERHPLKRPFFHPTSMKPKTARVLINLARLRKGNEVLDPFCGAGGVVLEAGLLGMKVYGWDVDKRMLDGCGRNLRHFGVRAALTQADALKSRGRMVDAVITDPPYGKSSSTLGVAPQRLYDQFVWNMQGNINKGGMLVFVLPKQYRPKQAGFRLESRYEIRVHKSLTRVIWVFQRI
jgi:tRNA (guanine10-N2)-dimethyltransferase